MSIRLDDMIQKENNIRLTMQSVDYRLAKLEELVLQNIETVSRLQSFTPVQVCTLTPVQIHNPSQMSPSSPWIRLTRNLLYKT